MLTTEETNKISYKQIEQKSANFNNFFRPNFMQLLSACIQKNHFNTSLLLIANIKQNYSNLTLLLSVYIKQTYFDSFLIYLPIYTTKKCYHSV